MSENAQQPFLFDEPPIHKPNLVEKYQDEKKLIGKATEAARNLVEIHSAFDTNVLTAEMFVDLMTKDFGFGIRLYLFEIVENLRSEHSEVGEFARHYLADSKLEEALSGKENKKSKDESTLDELFARSLDLRNSSKMLEVLRFVGKIRKYSPFNNTLVYLQRPDATHWATESHWRKEFHRTVKQDATPIIMLQPMRPIMLVYDVTDTEGDPLPKGIGDIFGVDGSFEEKVYDRTLENCVRLGIFVREKKLNSGHAGTAISNPPDSSFKLSIEINQEHDLKTKYATICHELAHIFLGHIGGDPTGKEWSSRIGLTRNQHELEAEAVAYLVCLRAGLQTRSDEYISLYLENENELGKISIEMIMKTAGKIENMGVYLVKAKEDKQESKQQ